MNLPGARTDDLTERTGIETNVALSGDLPDLDRDVALAVFRIVQEGLRNVEKHSDATVVDLRVGDRADLIELTLSDDGTGFRPESHDQEGMGLRSMRERAVLIGGDLSIESTPDAGTTVRLAFPRTAAKKPFTWGEEEALPPPSASAG